MFAEPRSIRQVVPHTGPGQTAHKYNMLSGTNTTYCLAQIQYTVWHKYNIMYGTNTIYCLVHIQHTVCHKYNILSGTTTIYCLAKIHYTVWHKYNIPITVTTQGLPPGVPAVRISIHILIRKTCVHLLRSISIDLIAENMAQISLLKLDKKLQRIRRK